MNRTYATAKNRIVIASIVTMWGQTSRRLDENDCSEGICWASCSYPPTVAGFVIEATCGLRIVKAASR